MKTILLCAFLFSTQLFSATFIVEMERPLSDGELRSYRSRGKTIELFDRTKTRYFLKTYRVEAPDTGFIRLHLPALIIERIHSAIHFSVEPKKDSKFLRPDELFTLQWGLFNQSQKIQKLLGGTKKVFTEGKAGVDIRWADVIGEIEASLKREPLVAVIDMGLDLDHPELRSRIFKNTIECGKDGEIIDSEEDKDKNGLKGDCMGWNFAARTMHEARRPYDDNSHGTHVAGIIAAESNGVGISGVSSKIRILPIRVTGNIDATSDRRSIQPLTDRIAKGILYAANMGADVINLSLGWTRSMDTKYLREAMDYAMKRGVVIVAAAGNNNNNASIFPCSHYDVLCVGAATIDGQLADFSNYGGEVDVIAPGDEIASTIPLQAIPFQLNVQGYDLRSGTSQAAPFVSAIAALLRGATPDMPRDEIIRRITDSADPGILGKSLSGMVNLKKAFELPPGPSIRPAFKNFSVALFDGPTNRFLYPLKIKNFGAEAKDVVVHIASASPSFKALQVFSIPILRTGEIVTLRLEGEISDPSAHNQIQIDVKTASGNSPEKTFRHEFRMAKDVLREPELRSVPFSFQDRSLPVGFVREGQVHNLINTVEDPLRGPGAPEFYLSRTVKETSSIELRIFREEKGFFREQTTQVLLPGATQILNVMKLDVNYDGEKDYLIRAIACEEACDDPAKAKRYIQYSFWKQDLRPLFGDRSIWKFLPDLVNVDQSSQRFIKISHKEFGDISVPAFIATGPVPDAQRVLKPFEVPDRSVLQRLYYLEPQINDSRVNLQTKTFSTPDLIERIKIFAGAFSSDEVHASHLLAQGPEEIKTGTVRALVSVGKGYLRKNLVLTLGPEEEKISLFRVTQNIWGYDHLISFGLNTSDLADAFVGRVAASRMVMLQTIRSKANSYDATEDVEAPLSAIAAFNGEGEEYTFFQTPSYLMLAHAGKEGVHFSRLKINRFSFLPGALFNDTFYPVLSTSDDGEKFPSLYVDETDIQSNLVSLTTYREGGLKSPLSLSAFIPPICRALNPVVLDEGQGHSLSLLCLEDKVWSMKFLEFVQ